LWLIALLSITFFVIYALAPVYDFAERETFSGDKIHNPYQEMDSTAWKKGNFHSQSRSWFGLTDGRKNTSKGIYAIYRQLGYDIAVITDYQKINTYDKDAENYIPAYEHGYGVRKTHQICLGSQKVTWLDYPVYQNISHKQHILNRLSEYNEVVFIAHPTVRKGYSAENMKYLTNYDLIEAVSHYANSLTYWDAALSSGQPVFVIANDDTHDIFDVTKVGRFCTFVNTHSLKADDVLEALRSGKSFGARINMLEGTDFIKRAEDHRRIPMLESVIVRGDTLFVEVSKMAGAFTFIGQNGIIKKSSTNTERAFYPIAENDSYIRTEIIFPDNSQFFLNPVFRYRGEPAKPPLPEINLVKTWTQRIVAVVIALIIFLMVVKLRKPSRKRGHIIRRQYYWE
jgi:hypothetical protein